MDGKIMVGPGGCILCILLASLVHSKIIFPNREAVSVCAGVNKNLSVTTAYSICLSVIPNILPCDVHIISYVSLSILITIYQLFRPSSFSCFNYPLCNYFFSPLPNVISLYVQIVLCLCCLMKGI